MKLIIQIPCYNEAETLPVALAELPREVAGFESVEWLIIDDGSTDNTSLVAEKHGVDHVVRHTQNMGLARAFITGLEACLALGADVIVNTDADNQYRSSYIPSLVRPILDGHAEYVIGARPISQTEHFSWLKKRLQNLGSLVVRLASNTKVADAPSGFRAMSRECALQLNTYNTYTYTLETIIQAGQKGIAVSSVPVETNEDLRESRLFKTTSSYVRKSILTIIRIFVVYRPFLFFMSIAVISLLVGAGMGLRYVYFWLNGNGAGHVQSLLLAAVLLISGFQTALVAFLADSIAANRSQLEDLRFRIRKRDP